MVTTVRDRIQAGNIILDAPLDLPEGSAVNIRIKTLEEPQQPTATKAEADAFFGMRAGREDLSDS